MEAGASELIDPRILRSLVDSISVFSFSSIRTVLLTTLASYVTLHTLSLSYIVTAEMPTACPHRHSKCFRSISCGNAVCWPVSYRTSQLSSRQHARSRLAVTTSIDMREMLSSQPYRSVQ